MKKSGIVIALLSAITVGIMFGYYIGINQNGGQIEIMQPGYEIGLVNLNTATIDELVLIPGIGDITAQRIIDYRERKGNFETIEDLLNISGISKDKLKDIQHYLTIK